MKTIATINSGVVTNISVWDGNQKWTPPTGATCIDVTQNPYVGVGSTYDGVNFTSLIGATYSAGPVSLVINASLFLGVQGASLIGASLVL